MHDPIDFSYRYSDVAKARKPSIVKKYYKYYKLPGIGNLAGGLPNPSFFPADEIEFKFAKPSRFDKADKDDASNIDTCIPKFAGTNNFDDRIDIATSWQYGQATGYPALLNWVKKLVAEMHGDFQYNGGPDVVMSFGNTDALSKVIEVFTNEWCEDKDATWAREGILVEEFTYVSAYQLFEPRGLNCTAIKTDNEGMKVDGPDGLKSILENWDKKNGKLPHLMYVIPTGQNPMGTVMSNERKQAIYEIAKEYDIIVIEDDPYWFLQFDVDDKKYKESLRKTFVSYDTDGRVIRLDSFSKLFSPGSRLGWITGQPAILEKINEFTEVRTQGPAGITQAIFAQLLVGKENNPWDIDGFFQWCRGVNSKYRHRRDLMCDILDQGKEVSYQSEEEEINNKEEYVHVQKEKVIEFIRPEGGMFVWLHIKLGQHPCKDSYNLQELSHALWKHLITTESRVILCPGEIFGGNEQIRQGKACEYFRICFSAVGESEVEKFSQRLVNGVESFWDRDCQSIGKLLEDD